VSAFVLDASFTLMWCFADRATSLSDDVLKRLEAGTVYAVVPSVWQFEVANGLGKAVAKGKLSLHRAFEVWEELRALPIQEVPNADIPELLQLAVTHNLSVYDTCYLNVAIALKLPLATNDHKLKAAVEASGLTAMLA
jgi:predicted nucleic acid-binding protein